MTLRCAGRHGLVCVLARPVSPSQQPLRQGAPTDAPWAGCIWWDSSRFGETAVPSLHKPKRGEEVNLKGGGMKFETYFQ